MIVEEDSLFYDGHCYFKNIIFIHFRPRTELVKFLRGRAQIADNFRRNYFACGISNFNRTVFPITPVTS
jgi:hypothetical protein